ncbi:RIP metalloprotease RseP [Ahrensia kielensis]|uniref:RIP metalloprotease RseP n=1 Tax=Ahrensia kielensis TaxID=76980 RepID=UPI00037CA2E5|nr:RIP metalloprotease RseP [Ahrensia kielensis]
MEFVSSLISTDGFILGTLVPFLFVLTIVVFIHELGHYWVGRLCGIGATTFSVGFGPEIFGINDKRGTRWRLSLIPLGGYVKFVGDMNAASTTSTEHDPNAKLSVADQARAFHNKAVWRRAATVAAGPIANFILAIVIFSVITATYGRTIADPIVAEVRTQSAAEAAGIQVGDIFVSVDGASVETFSDVQRYVAPRAETPIVMRMRRGDEELDLTVTPERLEIEDRFGNKMEQGIIGVTNNSEVGNFRKREYGIGESLWMGVKETGWVIARTGGYLSGVVTGREKADQIGGPIRVAQVSGQVATLGFAALLNLAAILSVSIGLLNLLPIPVLDGGHLLFYLFETVLGKPLSERTQEFGYRIGFALILGLMVFATWNDVTRIFSAS